MRIHKWLLPLLLATSSLVAEQKNSDIEIDTLKREIALLNKQLASAQVELCQSEISKTSYTISPLKSETIHFQQKKELRAKRSGSALYLVLSGILLLFILPFLLISTTVFLSKRGA